MAPKVKVQIIESSESGLSVPSGSGPPRVSVQVSDAQPGNPVTPGQPYATQDSVADLARRIQELEDNSGGVQEELDPRLPPAEDGKWMYASGSTWTAEPLPNFVTAYDFYQTVGTLVTVDQMDDAIALAVSGLQPELPDEGTIPVNVPSGLAVGSVHTVAVDLVACGVGPYRRLYGVLVEVAGFTSPAQKAEVRLFGDAALSKQCYVGEFDNGLFPGAKGTADTSQAWKFRNYDGVNVAHVVITNIGAAPLPELLVQFTVEPF